MLIFPFWAQQQIGIGELIQLLFLILIVVVPTVLRFFGEHAAQKQRQRLTEEEVQKHLLDAFNAAVAEESREEPVIRPRPKKERKRKPTDSVLATDAEPPTRGTPLSRELAPQGEGSRFDAKPGTLEASQILTPSVEPTVQPTLESMTGIYDVHYGGETNTQMPLVVDMFRMLTTPDGVRQAIVLSEILRRPEW